MPSLAVLKFEQISPEEYKEVASTVVVNAPVTRITKGMDLVPRMFTGMDALVQRVYMVLFDVPRLHSAIDSNDPRSLRELLMSPADDIQARVLRQADIVELIQNRQRDLLVDQTSKNIPSSELLARIRPLFVNYNTTTRKWEVGIAITNLEGTTVVLGL